jgi:putative ABC transport system ATP-binding protein
MGFVFQTFRLIESLSALQNVAMVLEFAGRSHREAHHRARELLSQLGVGHLAKRKPGRFSQGEKQRVAIARAMANSPSLILADEPTACLESEQGLEIIRLLHKYASEGYGCVFVASHDLRLSEYADRVYHLQDGTLMELSSNQLTTTEAPDVGLLSGRPIDPGPAACVRSSS